MKQYNHLKTLIAFTVAVSGNSVCAGDFLINADGAIITGTDTGQSSNNADIGYDNTLASSTDSFIYGGTNTLANAAHVTVVGGGNNVIGPESLDSAYVFGQGNGIDVNGGGVYLFGADNDVFNETGYGRHSTGLFNIHAIGANNVITNIDHMSGVFALGLGNTVRDGRISGAQSDISRVFAIGANNDLHTLFSVGFPKLEDAYAFGSGNIMSAAGRFSNVFAFGTNNKIINPSDTGVGNIVGGLALGDGNTIHVPGGNIMMNVYAIGASNTMGAASGGGVTNSYAIGTRNSITASGAAAIGSQNSISHENTFILGNSAASTHANGVILGNNSADGGANPVTIVAIDAKTQALVAGSSPVGIVSVGAPDGERQIINVAAGRIAADSTDAVNGSELYITNEALAGLGATVADLASNALSWNAALGAYDASHGMDVVQRITNVSNGAINTASSDAINGSQLYNTAAGIINILGTGTVNPDGTVTGGQFIINGGTFGNATSALFDLSQTVNNILSGDTGLVFQDAVTGNITIGATTGGSILNIAGITGDRRVTGVATGTAGNDAVNVAQLNAAIADAGGSTPNAVVYDSEARTTLTLGGPTVTGTGAGLTGGTRITNLALAAINAASTDAVAGSQLFDTNQRVTNLENAVAVIISGTSGTGGGNTAWVHFSTGHDDPSVPATATGGNAVAAGMGASASGASSSAVGAGANASGQKSIAIGSLSEARASGGIALGNNAVVVAAATNSVAIGADSVATDPDTVSFGSETLQRRLVNVADGINPHDAVTMRQLAAVEGAMDGRFADIQNQVNAVSDRMDRVGAMSAAMNQVQTHLAPDGNRNRLALGMGFYRGHGALALGYEYVCRQGDRGARASFALSDRGDVMGGAGLAFGW
ncbi:YadA-like family protein [Termitidicoccus mucosus]|uniref:Trimeric autotransporter adhesin YadA-like C-terminal membrane anchor domain-containing protein n=1 Tax=Termitidicoccus mucosus TaxID=1184151 RepID=A0A178IJA2_9BACT|nr:hypothetical protein AW736_11790 [Opitutaceae bacterium TSB47]